MQKGKSYFLIDDKIHLMDDDFSDDSSFTVKQSDCNLLEGYNILVVDDNPINLTVAEKTLSRFSGKSFKCLNAEDAFKLFQTTPIDLILMDLHMPIMDGFEATKKIKASQKYIDSPIAIMAYTTYAYNDVKTELDLNGFDGYIGKPFTHVQVLDTILNAINKFK
ncbi:MAG: CheY-like chemotaxis protein [Roseivirga sp.]|jgi:CheY-like chemotaxis protein